MGKLGKVQRRAAALSGSAELAPEALSGGAGFTRAPPELPAAISDGVLWIPSEHVHIARVNLPLVKLAGRMKALPFAFEPLLGQPIEEVHVALGPAVGGADYVAAAISRKTMQTYADQAGSASKLVPDVFMLPVASTQAWTAGEIDGRVMVRTREGAGFAASREAFALFHEAAGRPDCQLMFGSPEGLPPMVRRSAAAWPGPADLLDMRHGVFAAGRQAEARRPVLQAQIAAAVLAVFTLALGAETWAVAASVDRQRARLSAGLAAKYPALPETSRAAETIELMSAGLTQTDPGGMMAVLSVAAGAFEPGGAMALQRADFSAGEARLDLSLEAGTVEALYAYVSRLETEGLTASLANVETIPGGAEGIVSIAGVGGTP